MCCEPILGALAMLHDWYSDEIDAHRRHHTLSRWLCCMFIFDLTKQAAAELRQARAAEDPAARAG